MADRAAGAARVISLAPLANRITQAARYVFQGKPIQPADQRIAGISENTWMSPGQPIRPSEQQVKGRAWDFPPGVNIRYHERYESEQIGFKELRNLADYCDLVRLAIETRKDQVCAARWDVVSSDRLSLEHDDPRLERIRSFIRRPDGRMTYSSWTRTVLEEMFVIDAATVYVRPNLDGKPFGLEAFDGATIKPLIDEDGRTPMPPNPAYQQVLKGVPAVDFTAAELLYMPRNPRAHKIYGYSQVEQIAVTVNIAIKRQLHKLQYYDEGSTPDFYVGLPADWTVEQIERFRGWWNDVLQGNTAARRRGMMGPETAKPVNLKEAVLKDDYDEWLARVVQYAFSLPAHPYIRNHARADVAVQQEVAQDEGLVPTLNWWRDFWNTIIHDYLGEPELDFAYQEQIETDPKDQAGIDEIYVRSGIKSIDEIRARNGDDPLGIPLGVITATGFQPLVDQNGKYDWDESDVSAGVGGSAPGDKAEPGAGDAPSAPAPGNAAAKRLQKRHRMRAIDRNREQISTLRDGLAASLAGAFKKMAPRIADQTVALLDKQRGMLKVRKDEPPQSESQLRQHLASLVAKELGLEEFNAIVETVSDALGKAASDGVTAALEQINVKSEDTFNFASEDVADYADERAAEMVGKRLVNGELIDNPNAKWAITETTRDIIRRYVMKAEAEGWTNEELKKKLIDSVAFSSFRAEMVARTELAKADVAGNMAAWHASGIVVGKDWLLSNMHPRTDVCDANAEQGEIPLNEPFVSGDQGPPAHPLCECDVVPVVDQED